MSDKPVRLLPELNEMNRPFWTGGKDGKLQFLCCDDCGHFIHPPSPVCSVCTGLSVSPKQVSGKGTVYSYTVNMHTWDPRIEVPYVIAVVDLDDQPGLRLTTNIPDTPIEDIKIGARVRVEFEQCEDVWIPLFKLAE